MAEFTLVNKTATLGLIKLAARVIKINGHGHIMQPQLCGAIKPNTKMLASLMV